MTWWDGFIFEKNLGLISALCCMTFGQCCFLFLSVFLMSLIAWLRTDVVKTHAVLGRNEGKDEHYDMVDVSSMFKHVFFRCDSTSIASAMLCNAFQGSAPNFGI